MSGVAAIASPLGARKAYLWKVNDQATAPNLAVELRSLDGDSFPPYKNQGCVAGVLRPGTGLASVAHNNMVRPHSRR
jgi:hypothetical protein